MYVRGLPSFDGDSQTLVHRKFKTPISDLMSVERVSAFGFLWGVRITRFGGGARACLTASRGPKRDRDEAMLEEALFSVMEAASLYWKRVFTSGLEEGGSFSHAGVTVRAGGGVSGHGVSADLGKGRFGHEIEGDVLRLKFAGSEMVTIDWEPGLARDAALAALYDIREKVRAMPRSKVDPGTENLRRKARARIDETVRDLAAVLSRSDVPRGRAKLAAFNAVHGLRPAGQSFMQVADRLLIRKSYIQKAFADIQRYHERTMQMQRPARLYEELIELAVHDGKLNARQLFALYEIGLHLLYSLPRITAMISAVQTGRDPAAAAAEADRIEREAEARRHAEWLKREERMREAEAQGRAYEAEDPGFEDFEPNSEKAVAAVPAALVPVMAILGIEVLTDEKALRAAWTARVRACHPDTLPPGSPREAVDDATQATAECNMAYSLLLDHIRNSR